MITNEKKIILEKKTIIIKTKQIFHFSFLTVKSSTVQIDIQNDSNVQINKLFRILIIVSCMIPVCSLISCFYQLARFKRNVHKSTPDRGPITLDKMKKMHTKTPLPGSFSKKEEKWICALI